MLEWGRDVIISSLNIVPILYLKFYDIRPRVIWRNLWWEMKNLVKIQKAMSERVLGCFLREHRYSKR